MLDQLLNSLSGDVMTRPGPGRRRDRALRGRRRLVPPLRRARGARGGDVDRPRPRADDHRGNSAGAAAAWAAAGRRTHPAADDHRGCRDRRTTNERDTRPCVAGLLGDLCGLGGRHRRMLATGTLKPDIAMLVPVGSMIIANAMNACAQAAERFRAEGRRPRRPDRSVSCPRRRACRNRCALRAECGPMPAFSHGSTC